MPGPDPDNALVDAWDNAWTSAAWQRPISAAQALLPADEGDALEHAPLGAVNRRLLEMAGELFGPRLECLFTCWSCGEPMEASIPIGELLASAAGEGPAPFRVELATGVQVLARLPAPADVAAAASCESIDEALRVLVRRTVVDRAPGVDPFAHAEALSAAFEARDPLGVVTVEVSCPACGEADSPVIDIAQWFWAAVDRRVRQLLDEVHLLAAAYGWSEQEILALGPRRRAAYLEWVA